MATASPFPEGDPRNAAYFENIGKLEQARGLVENEDIRLRGEANKTAQYNISQLQKAEPLSLKNNANRANTEGLATSGILGARQGQTQTQYAGKEYTVGQARTKAIEATTRADERARERFNEGQKGALQKATEEAKTNLLANPPAAAPTAPVNPGGTRVLTGLPGAGGVQPYEETSKGGSVRVGEGNGLALARAPTSQNARTRARQEAIRKALGVG
jgi:hypothetical protein